MGSDDASRSLDRAQLEHECDEFYLRVGGPGGQHRNRRETGVRLVHRPTGTVVSATERRSRERNRGIAYARLAAELARQRRTRRPRRPTRPSRAARRRRLEAKRKRGALKALRGPVDRD
ncbi:MAG: peptide chain release factor-like protein [Deltaproteobacteria bacterium]|nr:MAG: peptide chain release factor-like protein [Deltaproteobacteria bacterium]